MHNWEQYRNELSTRFNEIATMSPDTMKAFAAVSNAPASTNLLGAKMHELISLAVAVTTRCDGCIAFHAAKAKKLGVTAEEITEALSVAIGMNAGAAMVYSGRTLDAFANS